MSEEPRALFLDIKKQVVDIYSENNQTRITGVGGNITGYRLGDQERAILFKISEDEPPEVIITELKNLKEQCINKQENLIDIGPTCVVILRALK